MKSEKIYNAWKESKSHIDIQENFKGEVMNRIYRYERDKRKSMFDVQRLIELISEHQLAKAAVVTAGAGVGFVRIFLVVYTFLAC